VDGIWDDGEKSKITQPPDDATGPRKLDLRSDVVDFRNVYRGPVVEKPFPVYEGGEPYVFVCYAHEDSAVVYPEIAWLHAHGINIWYDEGISAGTNWRASIGDSLLGASRVLFYISRNSLESDHCNREINLALDERLEVVPVYLEDVPLTADLKVGLNRVHALRHQQDPAYRQRLLSALSVDRVSEPSAPAEVDPLPGPQRSRWLWAASGLFVLALAVAGWLHLRSEERVSPVSGDLPSIAVLPFSNLSDDPDAGYLGEGIAEDLLNRLSMVDGIRVVARTSAFRFRDEDMGEANVSAILGVTHFLTGSVRRVGDNLRVVARLVSADDETQLWSERYDREVDDVFAIQDEIAESLVKKLQVGFGTSVMAARRQVSMAAYALVQQARQQIDTLSSDGLRNAIGMLSEATEIDPTYFDAWYELSRAYGLIWALPYGDTSERMVASSDEALQRAMVLDPENPLAQNAMIRQLAGQGHWADAFRMMSRSLESYPRNPDLADTHAYLLAKAGRIDEALSESGRALELDPLNPTKLYMHGLVQLFASRFDEAVATMERAVDLGADSPWIRADLGLANYYAGQQQAAIDLWSSVDGVDAVGDPTKAGTEDAFLAMVRRTVQTVKAAGNPCEPNPWGAAYTAALVEDADLTFECLRQAARENRVLHIMGHHQFRKYRSDPRFAEVLAMTGLDQVVDPALLKE
jgi:TolB-like protein